MKKRNVLIATAFVVAAALISLLAYAQVRSGGQPSGLVVNKQLGEVAIKEKPAPTFTLTTLDGKQINLADFKGKVVMVDFWSSWCPPCKAEAPDLEQAYQEFHDQGVEFIGVAIWDTKSPVQSFAQQNNLQYPIGLDDNGTIAIDYGVTGIPEKYFINKDGTIVKKYSGPMTVTDISKVLTPLLSQ